MNRAKKLIKHSNISSKDKAIKKLLEEFSNSSKIDKEKNNDNIIKEV